MGQTTLYPSGSALAKYDSPDGNFSSDLTVTMDVLDELLLQFQAPDSLKFKELTGLNVFIYAATSGTASLGVRGLYSSFDPSSVTYNTIPRSGVYADANISFNTSNSPGYVSNKYSTNSMLVSSVKNGISVRGASSARIATSRNSIKPYIVITHSDADVGLSISNLSPSKGSIVAANQNKFTWQESRSIYTIETTIRTSAKFRWRQSASDTVKEIDVPGTATSITTPANTFSGDSIQWQISVTANSGVTTTSDWMTLSLVDVDSTAVAVAPDRAVLDGASDNVFKWEHVISTGTAQTKAELQQSTDGSTWTALATVTGTANTWTAPAGTFTSGTKYWRVRTYNSKGAAGAWSAATQFIVLAAPATPPVSIVYTEPRPEIRWQSDEQQAYQVEIDGVYASGTRFGTGKTWKAPFYLADGSYTVRVRVQNEYGFWSPWGTAALPVTNVPGGAITLTASTENAVTLAWVDSDNYDFYIVYRDGTPIAKVEEHGYVDNMAIGACTYQVRGCYSGNDYYGVSAEVSVSVTPKYNVLYDMDAGEWLTMKYSGLTNQPVTRSISRSIAEVRLSGYTYPVAERSKAKTATYDGNVVFLNRDSAEKFEGMIGHLVCLKLHPSGGCIGYLNEVSGEVNQYKSVYSFMVTQIEYEEEIDIDS